MNIVHEQPSEDSQIIQAALEEAVSNALEKKRRLGHYFVVWENGQIICKGEDAPKTQQCEKTDNAD